MNKKKLEKKDNVVNFPSKLTSIEKEIEAVIFAAAEPLDVDTTYYYVGIVFSLYLDLTMDDKKEKQNKRPDDWWTGDCC